MTIREYARRKAIHKAISFKLYKETIMRHDVTNKLNNKRMNNQVYQLKRDVINIIYDLKRHVNLPRITVRITDKHHNVLGRARLNDNVIWIPENTFNTKYLYQVVLHEILHAVYGIQHNNKCKLMHEVVQNVSNKEALKIFLDYCKKQNLH